MASHNDFKPCTLYVTVAYDETRLPEFATESETRAFHEALGRQLAYGLRYCRSSDYYTGDLRAASLHLQVERHTDATGHILPTRTADVEIVGCYHAPIDSSVVIENADGTTTRRWCSGPQQPVDNALTTLTTAMALRGRPFVIGAIGHEDGTFSYHS
jgi:hypothetical protein